MRRGSEDLKRGSSPGGPVRGAGGGAWTTDTMPHRVMATWQERIKPSSEPALEAERALRYRYAAPAIAAAKVWCDIRLDGEPPAAPEGFAGEALVLAPVDVAQLNSRDGLVVTCFDVVERLDSFAPLVEGLESLKNATVLLSVPNAVAGDSAWGEGAFAELRSLLPGGHAVAAQTSLAGSAIGPESGTTPTYFIATWGGNPLEDVREVADLDLTEQRDWVHRQLADLAFYKAAYEQLKGESEKPAPRELPPAS
jgi:hypothetical protein